MSFFGKILEKLGIKEAAARPTATVQAPVPAPAPQPAAPAPVARPAAPPPPVAVSVVDVVAALEGLAASNPEKLNWRESIVDLLKLLDLDSSYGGRKELAAELECPIELMGESAKMNVWLHKTVLQKIAANGGNIPQELII